jgi:hypothetical protein
MTHTEKNKPIKQTVTKWRHFFKKRKETTTHFLFCFVRKNNGTHPEGQIFQTKRKEKNNG